VKSVVAFVLLAGVAHADASTPGAGPKPPPARESKQPPPRESKPPRRDAQPAEDARERARKLFMEGTQHYNLTEYDQALTKFREANALVSAPALLFNIAQCERKLGDKRAALRDLRAVVAAEPAMRGVGEIQKLIAELEAELAPPPKR
jgi:tetratricopeptide (TPR) repeat protein